MTPDNPLNPVEEAKDFEFNVSDINEEPNYNELNSKGIDNQQVVQFDESIQEDPNPIQEKDPQQVHSTPEVTCPSCGEGVIRNNQKAWGCSNWDPDRGNCKFTIWKKMMGTHDVTEEEKDYMIKNKESPVIEFTSKAGKQYKAKMVFDKGEGFKPEFKNSY